MLSLWIPFLCHLALGRAVFYTIVGLEFGVCLRWVDVALVVFAHLREAKKSK